MKLAANETQTSKETKVWNIFLTYVTSSDLNEAGIEVVRDAGSVCYRTNFVTSFFLKETE